MGGEKTTVDRCEKCNHEMDTKRFEVAWEIDYKDYVEMLKRVPNDYRSNPEAYFGQMLGVYLINYLEELKGGAIDKNKFKTVDMHDEFICRRAANMREMK